MEGRKEEKKGGRKEGREGGREERKANKLAPSISLTCLTF